MRIISKKAHGITVLHLWPSEKSLAVKMKAVRFELLAHFRQTGDA